MTTVQFVALVVVAAITVMEMVRMITRPAITGDDILKAVTTAVIMAKEENRCLSVKISDHEIEVFCGSRREDADEPQEAD